MKAKSVHSGHDRDASWPDDSRLGEGRSAGDGKICPLRADGETLAFCDRDRRRAGPVGARISRRISMSRTRPIRTDGDFVTLASTTDKNLKEYLNTKETINGYSISNIQWSDQVGETKVTISKDGQFATLTFNEALLSQAIQNPVPAPRSQAAGVRAARPGRTMEPRRCRFSGPCRCRKSRLRRRMCGRLSGAKAFRSAGSPAADAGNRSEVIGPGSPIATDLAESSRPCQGTLSAGGNALDGF